MQERFTEVGNKVGDVMLSIERQREITNILLEKKSVSVAELSERFRVSFETIRRDLKALEADGVVEKSYGGAVLKERVGGNVDFKTLSHIMVDTKRRMASKAREFIKRGDCIFIDFSTTCGQIVPFLEELPINVLTNSLEVMNGLVDKKNVTLFSTGGCWDSENCAFMGNTAVHSLGQFHLDKAFISCRALSMERGISDKTEAESEIRKTIVESSNEVYLLADSTKINRVAFIKTCEFSAVKALITDKELSEEWKAFLEKHGVEWYCCDTGSEKRLNVIPEWEEN